MERESFPSSSFDSSKVYTARPDSMWSEMRSPVVVQAASYMPVQPVSNSARQVHLQRVRDSKATMISSYVDDATATGEEQQEQSLPETFVTAPESPDKYRRPQVNSSSEQHVPHKTEAFTLKHHNLMPGHNRRRSASTKPNVPMLPENLEEPIDVTMSKPGEQRSSSAVMTPGNGPRSHYSSGSLSQGAQEMHESQKQRRQTGGNRPRPAGQTRNSHIAAAAKNEMEYHNGNATMPPLRKNISQTNQSGSGSGLQPVTTPDISPPQVPRHSSAPCSKHLHPEGFDQNRPFKSFSAESLQALLKSAGPFDLANFDLPSEEMNLLNTFVDALSKLTVEIQLDTKKRPEGRRRLNNALRALEGWI